jgi:phosphoribosylanthranilate isomerase
MTTPAVKICGLTTERDAHVAIEAGADYLGAILSEGFSRSIRPEVAARFVTPGGPPVVGVFVDTTPKVAAEAVRTAGAGVIQLHGEESPTDIRTLREEGPWQLWKAVRVRSTGDVERALEEYGTLVDGLLLEGWHSERGGGVGARFSWEIVASVRSSFPAGLTFIAAGGLVPDNVQEAVSRLVPDVVDVSSGVESRRGVKDPESVRAFIRNARARQGS